MADGAPRRGRRFGIHYDPDQFGQFSEAIARFLGTARFLVMQSAVVIVWIGINLAWGFNVGNIRDGGWEPTAGLAAALLFGLQRAHRQAGLRKPVVAAALTTGMVLLLGLILFANGNDLFKAIFN